MTQQNQITAVIGTYAEAADAGLYVTRFDTESGRFEVVQELAGFKNPTYVDIDSSASRVYSLFEESDAEGKACGAAAAFELSRSEGRLSLINQEETVPASICHIVLDHKNRTVITSSYHGGMLGLNPVREDGSVGPTADISRHQGSSLLPVQDRARAHSFTIDRSNRFGIACDLGLDRLMIYLLGPDKLNLIKEVAVKPGSGPRHFAFHPSLPYAYVINELNSTVISFAFDDEQGDLRELQTVSTLPKSYSGDNACADIHISPDGRFLYGSNRGHDSIAVYAIDPDGRLTLVEHASTRGGHPRSFAISPDGRFVVAANRDGNNLVVFHRDADTGKLEPAGQELTLPKPVCIKFVTS